MSHTMTKEESLLNNQVLQDTHQKMVITHHAVFALPRACMMDCECINVQEGLVRHGILSHAASKYLSRVTQRFSHQVCNDAFSAYCTSLVVVLIILIV